MRKQDLNPRAVVGQTSSGLGQSSRQFGLLQAIPFTLNDGQLRFSLPEAASQMLRLPLTGLPQTLPQWQDRLDGGAQRARNSAMKRLTWDGAQYAVRYQMRLMTGEQIWVEEIGERLSGTDRGAGHIIGVMRRVDQEQEALQRAAYESRYDAISGLMNTGSFAAALDHSCALIRRQRSEATLLRLRVTNLGDINTIYGYDIGDKMIGLIGERLRGLLRAPDHIGRITDTDFGICLLESGEESVEKILPRLQDALSDTPYATPHGGLYLEFSIAGVKLGDSAQNGAEALSQSQTVFAKLGDTSGWRVLYHTSEMAEANPEPVESETGDEIIAALNERRVSLAYQPIIDARTRDLHHYECLLRLRREDGEIVSAGSIIMAAERLGLVHLLDRRAMELAAETLRAIPDIHLALNVSAATLKDNDAVDDYIMALKALGPNAQRLTLELTETAALDDPALASFFSVETRKLGCSFAIDDFGSGYTTFRNLMSIEADSIKIDGSYIQGIAKEPHKETFVRMMVDLAQTFSVKTVAEMVDNRADAELLRRLGVDYLQGYMFGIPSAAPAWRRTG